jgi:hypothetical protein
MATLLTEVNSVLGIEIGSIQTRAVYFDVVEESYQFIAAGSALSTHGEPCFDVMIGVIEAINQLQGITGKFFLDLNKKLIIPSHGGVEGVDKLILTLSCGPDLDAVTFGLLNDISLEAANRLAKTLPLNVLDNFGINDKRSIQNQIDALLVARPDILILAGGSDRGATRSVARMANMIASSLQLMSDQERPQVLYCGNHAMTKRVKEILERTAIVIVSNNIKPEIETEEFTSASIDLNQIIVNEKIKQINGLERIAPVCSDQPLLTSLGFQRVIKFLGKQYDPTRGVLGIDLGSAHTVISYANHQECTQNTLPIGTGIGLENTLKRMPLSEIEKWLPEPVSEAEVLNYLWQKTIYPKNLPATNIDLDIELALLRFILSLSMNELMNSDTVPSRNFEPILVSGSSLTHTATPWQVLITLLDGIQPVGITPLVVDKHGILALLGAAARRNPLLPVQVLESTAFINLATVVNVESKARFGSVLLEGHLQTPSGTRHEVIVRQGSITSIPLAFGEPGLLTLKAMRKLKISDIEINGEPIKVKGGVCGLVFDARGRPLMMPSDGNQRRELLKRWLNSQGGQ